MSDLDPLRDLIGRALSGGQPDRRADDLADLLRRERREHEERVAALKAKSRTLIDRAWNRAIDGAAEVARANGAPPDAIAAIRAMRREERA